MLTLVGEREREWCICYDEWGALPAPRHPANPSKSSSDNSKSKQIQKTTICDDETSVRLVYDDEWGAVASPRYPSAPLKSWSIQLLGARQFCRQPTALSLPLPASNWWLTLAQAD